MEIISAAWATDGGSDSISIAAAVLVVFSSINIYLRSHRNIHNAVHDHIMTCPPLHRHCIANDAYFTVLLLRLVLMIFVVAFFLVFLHCTTRRYILLFFLMLLLLWLAHVLWLLFVGDVKLYASLFLVLFVRQITSESRPACRGLSDAFSLVRWQLHDSKIDHSFTVDFFFYTSVLCSTTTSKFTLIWRLRVACGVTIHQIALGIETPTVMKFIFW